MNWEATVVRLVEKLNDFAEKRPVATAFRILSALVLEVELANGGGSSVEMTFRLGGGFSYG